MKMSKADYAKEIAEAVGGVVKEINKNNGTIKTGVTVTNQGEVAPVMYVDEAYEEGRSVEEMVERFNMALEKANKEVDVMELMSSYENVKDRIGVKLINKAKNANVEVYRSAKTYGFPDLIIVPFVRVTVAGQEGRAVITNRLLETWGITKRTVIDRGIKNTECVVQSLAEKLAEMCGGVPEMYNSPFTICTTPDGHYGAIAIIKAKERLNEMYPDGYYVIPSSVHEVLVLPKDTAEEGMLNNLIGEVNTEVLAADDYLSGQAYEFNVA